MNRIKLSRNLLAVCLLALSTGCIVIAPSHAGNESSEGLSAKGSAREFGRGVTNVAFSWLELPHEVENCVRDNRSGSPYWLIISDEPAMTIPCTWKYQVIKHPTITPMIIPARIMVTDSSMISLVSRRGVVPIAISTPNSLVRSKIAIKKVLKILKATTITSMK